VAGENPCRCLYFKKFLRDGGDGLMSMFILRKKKTEEKPYEGGVIALERPSVNP
jgi:hypothetical protein